VSGPDQACLKAVRVQIQEGLEKLNVACAILRRNGWVENADELSRTVKHGRVWTQKDGWLDMLEKP
jgi:hypothetical protein